MKHLLCLLMLLTGAGACQSTRAPRNPNTLPARRAVTEMTTAETEAPSRLPPPDSVLLVPRP